MSSLLELTKNYQNIVNQIIESGGHLPAELEAQLSAVEVQHPEKVDAYSVVLERLKAEEAYLRSKAAEFEAVARGCKNAQQRLKDAIKNAASILGVDEIKGNDTRFKISESEPLLHVNTEQLSKEYCTEKQTILIEKEALRDKIELALKNGDEVTGASYKTVVTLRQYVNKSSGAKNAKRID